MADETIVNKLGFSVEDALRELQRLDSALQSSGTAFQTFGERINAWNSQSDAALSRMKDMASAASRLASSMAKMGNGVATPAAPAGAAPASKLWLPSDVSEEIQKANQSMTNLGDTATRAGEKMRQAGEHGKKAGHDAGEAAKKAHEHTKDWTVTWETLTRVVMTQAIVRALSQIRDLLRESVDEALKFSTKISEIQTIAPRIDRNFQGLSKEIANMAREFNFPLPDVAEATYQTISDQFTSAAQRADIMTAAAKLARVGVMDLNEAAQLLTGTLNAYGMASSQADIVAAKFFQTVNLGRVRGAELTPIIGRIVPIANELGVSLDEVNSSMAALTISSMKPAEAATAFRSALSALIKPSEQMQKEMAALGYATPQLAVKAEGLQGIFLKLKDTTDENVAAMAKLFLNIRGLNAEARLTGEGAEKVAEAMKAMTAPNLTDSFNEMVKVFTSTDAQQYTKELNKFKVTLATEVGPELVKFLKTLLDAAGGADGLASAIKSIATSLTSLAELLGPVGGLLALFSLRGKLAGMTGFKGVVFNNVVAPLTMAAWTVDYLDSQMASMLDNANAKFRKDVEEIVAAQKKAAQTRLDAEMKVYDEAGRRLAQYAAEVRRALNVQVEQTRKANEELVISSRTTMQAMITAREKVVQQFRAAAQDANKAAEDSMKRQADAQAKLDDLLFKRRLEERQKYDDYFKKPEVTSDMYGRRALELAREAADLLTKAETPDQERTAQAVFQRAAAYAQEAEQIAKGTENEWLRKRAADTVEDIIRKQIAAEKELQTNSAARASAAARAAAQEQARVDRMKVLMKGILEDLDLFDKKGQKEPKVTAALSEDLKQKMAAFKKEWLEGTAMPDVGEMLKFDDLGRRVKTALEGGVSEAEVQKLFAAPKTIDDFRAQIEAGLNKKAVDIAVLMPVASPELAKKLLAEMPLPDRDKYIQQQNTAYEKQSELVKKLEGEQQTLTDGMTRQKAAVGSLAANMEIYQKGLEGLPFWMNAAAKAKGAILGGGDIQKETKALADLIAQFRQLSETGGRGFGLKEYEELQKKATAVLAGPTATGWDQSLITNQMANLKFLAEQAEAMKKLQTPQGQPRDLEAELLKARQEAERLRELIDKLRPQAATEMGQGAQAAQNALSAIPSMAGLAGDIQEAATAMWDLAAASWSVQSPPPITAAKGRTVWNFLAFGGPAQGTDVIPAMLSPGEVVINAASARRFAAQLTAINAGVQPVYRSEGSSVTNIGDINVNVTGGGTSRQTAREIAAEIRRELRRGTATL